MAFKITFRKQSGEDVTIFTAKGDNILKLIRKTDIKIDAPCSGSKTCGKCRIKLLEGTVGGSDRRHLSQDDYDKGWRLACASFVQDDVVIYIPDTLSSLKLQVLNTDLKTISKNNVTFKYIEEKYNIKSTNDDSQIFGLAVDLGTTTVTAILVDLTNGKIIAKADIGNSQMIYGADVIHRIIEQNKPGGIIKMQKTIVNDTLLPLIQNLCDITGITQNQIHKVTIASNTTMNHLLLGVDANPIRLEPYVPVFLTHEPFDPELIGLSLAQECKIILTPNVGSYVGGDITSGTLASMIWDTSELSVLIDLGTNGEMVFGNNEFLMTCACSAGPAFEGGSISCGQRATVGAIEACVINTDTMEPALKIIGNNKPTGICGSGIIDIVAELYSTGIINGKGKFIRESSRIIYDDYGTGRYILAYAENTETGNDIFISEIDIDNFIRAKAAVYSALISLIEPVGYTFDDINCVKIAGGIGSGININNAIKIGMLPKVTEDKYQYIGNSSLAGAYAMLVFSQANKDLSDIADNMTYLELSAEPGYMDKFIAACFIPF